MLSYANRRRLEIARASCLRPKLLLLDEPTAGMNPAESMQMVDKILEINRKGVTVLVIEHDMNFIKRLCHRVVALTTARKSWKGVSRSEDHRRSSKPIWEKTDRLLKNAHLRRCIIPRRCDVLDRTTHSSDFGALYLSVFEQPAIRIIWRTPPA